MTEGRIAHVESVCEQAPSTKASALACCQVSLRLQEVEWLRYSLSTLRISESYVRSAMFRLRSDTDTSGHP